MRRSVATVLGLTGAFLLGATAIPAVPAADSTPGVRAPASNAPHFDEHRYRIIGKLRLVLFWAGRDDVGSARMTVRGDGSSNTLTFLVGSNPQRAPRNLNEWSYLREEVRPTEADVFALSSLDPAENTAKVPVKVPDGHSFGVSCASIKDDAVRSVHTKVVAPGVTYWMFDRLLDQIAASPQWERRRMPRPAGAAAGFLTAMQHVIHAGRTDARTLKALKPITYVYNDALYDLSIRGINWLGRTSVGTRTFDRLVRTDFSIRNRTTGEVSRFGLTYSLDQAGSVLPVQIFYQPSFWLRVELRLDDQAEVPADPAGDGSVLTRIRAICAGAAADAHPSTGR